jgi:hypothetical protein
MFEDFKDKIREHDRKDEKSPEPSSSLSPEIFEKLRQRGIDPENNSGTVIPRNLRPGWQRLILNVRCRNGNLGNIRENPQAPYREVPSVTTRRSTNVRAARG